MNDVADKTNTAGQDESCHAESMLPDVYEDLRLLACSKMAMESANHTLQPTALVHEAWLRLTTDDDRVWKNKACFIAVAAKAMRRILVDHARRKSRIKRGGDQVRVQLDDMDDIDPVQRADVLLMVEDALKQLELLHPQRAKVVELKYYGGMTNREVAESEGISEAKVERYWTFSKAWLHDQMSKNS